MVLVYNVNFGPWLNASNLGNKRESLQEYLQLQGCPPEDRSCKFGPGQLHKLANCHQSCQLFAKLLVHPVQHYDCQPNPIVHAKSWLATQLAVQIG
jgi:hypothetical protein